ncbi:MAG TPA: hypothetical protein VLA34_14800, partial [Candidatus Krumholzibacterium sp.]|nr:hypothetical protein [Candidatus Krumholzibacterium sp.]
MRQEEDRHKEDLYRAVSALSRERRSATLRGGVSVIVALAAAAFLVVVPALRLFHAWVFAPFAAWLVFWAAVAAGLLRVAVRAAAEGSDDYGLAEALGRKTGRGNLFSSAFEFASGGRRLENYSSWFMAETVRRAVRELEGIDGSRVFAAAGRPGWMTVAIVLAAALLILSLADPPGTSRALEALSDPSLSFRAGGAPNLRLTGGDLRVVAGDDVTAEALGFGRAPGPVNISYSEVDGVWVDEPVRAESRGTAGIPAYRRTFTDVRNDFSYRFTAGGESTGAVRVTVLHRPVINRITARLEYPPYTGASPDTTGTLAGRIASLRGTRIHIEGETGGDVSGGTIEFSSGRKEPLDGREGGFTADFELTSSDTMRFRIVDENGLTNEAPLAFPLVAREDDPPLVEILAPDDETVLPRSLMARVLVRANDDFGLSSLSLLYRKERSGGEFSRIRIPGEGGDVKAFEEEVPWQIDERSVFPGDRIAYCVEAR